jgi:antitoxin YefM
MSVMSASQARKSLFPLLEQVNRDHAEVVITSRNGNAVLISEEDFEAWKTTRYLFSTKANVEWLTESMAQASRGEAERHELVDP